MNKFLMLARKTKGATTKIRNEEIKIVGCFGLKAEIKKTFNHNGCKWYLVLNPIYKPYKQNTESKYMVCHETGFAISFGNTQKQLLNDTKDLLERAGHNVDKCVRNTKEQYDSIKICLLKH